MAQKQKGVAEVVWGLAEPLAEEFGYILWDVEFAREGSKRILRITIDSEEGVGVDDCEKMHRAIDPVLDEADPIEEAYYLAAQCGGIAYPAHIDRTSNGMVSVLGGFPTDPKFTAFELNNAPALSEYQEKYPHLKDMRYVVSSDAHELGAISEAENSILLEDEPYSSRFVTEKLFEYLRGV